MHQFSFEKLDVWNKAKELCLQVYKESGKFPDKEKFVLVPQLTRAALSVVSNIAEGTSRRSPKDQAHFIQIAYGSLMEVTCQLMIARDLGYISESVYTIFRINIEEISNKLNALRKYQLDKEC